MSTSKILLFAVFLSLVALLGLSIRQTSRLTSLFADLERARTAAAQPSTPSSITPADLKEILDRLNSAERHLAATEVRLTNTAAKVRSLENQVQSWAAQIHQPGPQIPKPPDEGMTRTTSEGQRPRRSWGHEQATGPPDTDRAGDIPTAWASQTPDGGEEWLKLDYSQAISLAEIRVRETHNPGAIRRIAAVLPNGQEVTIWEGVAEPAQAPLETVFPVLGNIVARSVKLYLDTRRVPGWNEIDAVQIMGRDGTSQWASQSSASSSFADH